MCIIIANEEERRRGIAAFAQGTAPFEISLPIFKDGYIELSGCAVMNPMAARAMAQILLDAADYGGKLQCVQPAK